MLATVARIEFGHGVYMRWLYASAKKTRLLRGSLMIQTMRPSGKALMSESASCIA